LSEYDCLAFETSLYRGKFPVFTKKIKPIPKPKNRPFRPSAKFARAARLAFAGFSANPISRADTDFLREKTVVILNFAVFLESFSRGGIQISQAFFFFDPFETKGFPSMGKGDKRTKRGKIFRHSFGKSRPKASPVKAFVATKSKPAAKSAKGGA
jgi:ribosomal small subunit protein bTHX